MGFCKQDEYDDFMRQVPEFERNLVRSGIHLFKFWFSVSRKEQQRRFKKKEGASSSNESSPPLIKPRSISGMTIPAPRRQCFSQLILLMLLGL